MDIIIIAGLAALILYKLYNVLGRRTGHEKTPPPYSTRERADDSPPERAAEAERLAEDGADAEADSRSDDGDGDEAGAAEAVEGPLKTGLAQIRRVDRSFDLELFLTGARTAFEAILDAFHKGELEKVAPLVNATVYGSFFRAIDERDRDGTRRRLMELVAINRCEAVAAAMEGHEARVTVRFESDQTDVVKDSEERIVHGDPTRPLTVNDIWTFARDTRSADPNWRLVATHSPG